MHQPDFGFLTDRMQVADGASVSLSGAGLIQPRAEGEIAFVLKRDLVGPRGCRALADRRVETLHRVAFEADVVSERPLPLGEAVRVTLVEAETSARKVRFQAV